MENTLLKQGTTFAKGGNCIIFTSETNSAQIVGGRVNITCEDQEELLPFLRELVAKLEEEDYEG